MSNELHHNLLTLHHCSCGHVNVTNVGHIPKVGNLICRGKLVYELGSLGAEFRRLYEGGRGSNSLVEILTMCDNGV